MKRKLLIVLFILSIGIMIVGFLHIPILASMGVDVFALRGLLIFTALPIVAIFSVPFAVCLIKLFPKSDKK